ncbi:MAG TPA: hypothetical protein VF384_13095 [Planctomycetota bacterium]
MKIRVPFRRRVPLLVLFAASACASPAFVRVDVPHNTTAPSSATVAGPRGKHGATVSCTATDTVFEKDGYRVTFVGHRGYRGTIGDRRGRLVVGNVVLTYDGSDIEFSGPLARGEITNLREGSTVDITQSGTSQSR